MTMTYNDTNLPTGAAELTADDVKALRQADDHVSFFWDNDPRSAGPHRPVDGFSYIRASKRVRDSDGPFNSDTRTLDRFIPLGHTIVDYRRDVLPRDQRRDASLPEIVGAAWTVSIPRHTPEWVTFTDLVRVGDSVTGIWTISNVNQTLMEKGLTRDEFRLQITRKNRVHTFLLDVEIIAPGSPLRRLTTR